MRRLISVVVLLVLSCSASVMAAQTVTEMRQEYTQSSDTLATLQKQLEQLHTTKADLTAAVDSVQDEVALVQEKLAQCQSDLSLIEQKLAQSKSQLAEIESIMHTEDEQYQEILESMETLVQQMHRAQAEVSSSVSSLLEYCLYLHGQAYMQVQDRFEQYLQDQQRYKKQLLQLEDEAAALQAQINTLKKTEQELTNNLTNKLKNLTSVQQQIKEVQRKVYQQEAVVWHAERTLRQALSFTSFQYPLAKKGVVSSEYGYRMHPILEEERMHTGVDLAVESGVSIKAAADGVVILAEEVSGYGLTVVIDHGEGLTTLYGHASKLLVKPGEQVQAGDTIALVGSTGLSTGPHLHFEVRQNQQHIDPWIWLG